MLIYIKILKEKIYTQTHTHTHTSDKENGQKTILKIMCFFFFALNVPVNVLYWGKSVLSEKAKKKSDENLKDSKTAF